MIRKGFVHLGIAGILAGATVALLAAALSGTALAHPDYLFVTPGGTGDCSQVAPCGLQTALSQADDGDVIYLAQGTYTTTGTIVARITATVALLGGWDGTTATPPVRDPDTRATTLDGEGQGRVVYISGDITPTLDGLRITNGSTVGNGGGIYVWYAHPIISGCHIYSNSAATGGGIYLGDSSNAVLTDNAIFGNVAGSTGGGVYLDGSDDVTLAGNGIYSNTALYGGGVAMVFCDDIALVNNMVVENRVASGGLVPGIKMNGSTALMLHNTIARNRGGNGQGVYLGTAYFGSDPHYSTAAMTNTILVSHTVGIHVGAGSAATLQATLWGTGAWANGTDWDGPGSIVTGTVNIWNDPAFLDPDGTDYHIGVGSAAIGIGVDAGVTDDIDGDPRPFCAGPDIGADEHPCCVRLHFTLYSSVQAAVDVAQDGDLVEVAGTCRGVQTRGSGQQVAYITKTLTVRGGYSDDFSAWNPQVYPTTLDAVGRGRVIHISGSGDITPTLEWLRLTNGSGGLLGGGVFVSNAGVVISSCHVFSNTASLGGGIYLDRSDHASLRGNEVYSNTASTWGGGLYLDDCDDASLEHNHIYGNAADGGRGGGVYLERSASAALTDNDVFDNRSSDDGGGIYLYESDDVTLTDNHIHDNRATGDDGGGLYLDSSDDVTLTGNHIYDNAANVPAGVGGGAYLVNSAGATLTDNGVYSNTRQGLYLSSSPTATLTDNEVYSNTLDGIYLSVSHAATLTGNEVHHNGWGGIALASSDDVTLSGNHIHNNATQRGGGVYLSASDDATLVDNEIHDNTAWFEGGGGVFLSGSANATLTGNEIYSNTANTNGGGICISNSPTATLTGNTIYSNTASALGGGVYLGSSNSVTITDNIIHHNTASQGGGLSLSVSQDSVLVNNVVVENRLGTTGDGAGIYLVGSTARFLHTTLARNTGGNGQGVFVSSPVGSTLWMTNTVLVSHTVGIEVDGIGAAATLTATLWGTGVWANGQDWINHGTLITGTVNIWGDPAFVDPDGGDYHLGPGSAAIDAGVDAGVATDIDGDHRPIGPAPDLGTDEAWRWLHLPLMLRRFP